MRLIKKYTPPNTEQLQNLKIRLDLTGNQMAELAGLSNGNQWRKYTGGNKPREMNQHILFFIAAQLALSDEQLKIVLNEMEKIGATPLRGEGENTKNE